MGWNGALYVLAIFAGIGLLAFYMHVVSVLAETRIKMQLVRAAIEKTKRQNTG